MRFNQYLGAAASIYAVTTARQFDIPEIDAAVKNALEKNPNYAAYTGPVAGTTVETNSTGSPVNGPVNHAAQVGGYW